MRRKARNPAQRLRTAVDVLPRRTRIAMLRGIEDNDIIAGGYSDKQVGGICPMLAAHRNGGRTSLASFARAWDRFTDARRPRLATARELRALRSYIELSLLRDEQGEQSLAALARRIKEDRGRRRAPGPSDNTSRRPTRADTGERHRARELRRRRRWGWLIPTRRYDVFADRLAAAEEQRSEQRTGELIPDRLTPPRPRAGSHPSG
ncbi:MAG TPA: hypothetical protein VE401_10365 [Solirubrobacterales bacterium]|nr:hypothetical protein [Solirubrobacterales bacterium]